MRVSSIVHVSDADRDLQTLPARPSTPDFTGPKVQVASYSLSMFTRIARCVRGKSTEPRPDTAQPRPFSGDNDLRPEPGWSSWPMFVGFRARATEKALTGVTGCLVSTQQQGNPKIPIFPRERSLEIEVTSNLEIFPVPFSPLALPLFYVSFIEGTKLWTRAGPGGP